MEQTTRPQGEDNNKGNWEIKPEMIYGLIGLVILIVVTIAALKTAPPILNSNTASSEQEILSETPTQADTPSPISMT